MKSHASKALLVTLTINAILLVSLSNLYISKQIAKERAMMEIMEEDNTKLFEELKPQDDIIEIARKRIVKNFFTHNALNEAEDQSVEDFKKSLKSFDMSQDTETGKKTKIEKTTEGALEEKKETESNGTGKTDKITRKENKFRKSTITYFLKGRHQDIIPNPIYTCIEGGFVVVNIEVDPLGQVIKAKVNRKRTTTKNKCLHETALMFAEMTTFNMKEDAAKVAKGFITYKFQSK